MSRNAALFFSIFVLVACRAGADKGGADPRDAAPDPRAGELREVFAAEKARALTLRDPATGWITPTDCDGMLWTGLYCAVDGVDGVELSAAEYATEPGRFDRRPPLGACAAENTDPGWSSWSKDMGTGLLACGWRKHQLALLERHATYGKDNHWLMGKPLGNGRAYYTPAFVGRLYQTILALGGEDDPRRLWPDLYPSGLTDYEAHLQVLNIWHRGEVAEALDAAGRPERAADAPPLPGPVIDDPTTDTGAIALDSAISERMVERLREHAARDPRDPLFAAVLGTYTGDMGPAVALLLDPARPVGEYVRCNEIDKCRLAAWLFAADIALRRLPP